MWFQGAASGDPASFWGWTPGQLYREVASRAGARQEGVGVSGSCRPTLPRLSSPSTCPPSSPHLHWPPGPGGGPWAVSRSPFPSTHLHV